MTTVRCDCGYKIVQDEGETLRVCLNNWRVNKTTGKVTANCPRCPKQHLIREGATDFLAKDLLFLPNVIIMFASSV